MQKSLLVHYIGIDDFRSNCSSSRGWRAWRVWQAGLAPSLRGLETQRRTMTKSLGLTRRQMRRRLTMRSWKLLADIQAPITLRMMAELQAEYDRSLSMLLALKGHCHSQTADMSCRSRAVIAPGCFMMAIKCRTNFETCEETLCKLV